MLAGSGEVSVACEGGVAVLTLHRPERLNAFNGAMARCLTSLYRACDEDDEVRAVVLTGAGRAFCAGADMRAGAATFGSAPAHHEGFSAAGIEFPAFCVRKPVIAAVNGHAIGIGLTLALQCDLRLFAREGRYGVVQVRRGVLGDAYSHWVLPRLVGVARAADILLTGRTFEGDEAMALGIANRVLPAVEVLDAALEIAREIATQVAPLSAALSKRLLWASLGLTLEEVGDFETSFHREVMGRPDATEGVLAWMEKRPPKFRARVAEDWPDQVPPLRLVPAKGENP